MTEGSLHLDPLRAALEQIDEIKRAGRQEYDAEVHIRLALQRLWIVAGEAARRHCADQGIDDGIEPWSELCRLRDYLAHHLLDEIDDARLWEETSAWSSDMTL